MSEQSMYEAQKKKMQGLCDEHDLVYKFDKSRYPIVFTIKPVSGVGEQISMLEKEDDQYCAPDSRMTWIFEDGMLRTVVTGGTFTISKVLRTKIENILTKMISYWQQFFFRNIMEGKLLTPEKIPDIDENAPEEDEENGTSLPDAEFDEPEDGDLNLPDDEGDEQDGD